MTKMRAGGKIPSRRPDVSDDQYSMRTLGALLLGYGGIRIDRTASDMAKASATTKLKPAKRAQTKLVAAAPTKKSAPVGFAVGDKVAHKSFGKGKVLSIRGDILAIQFGKSVTKEILIDYVCRA